eukprot:jgi/Mesvir1/10264/Mv13869-RA.1
MEEENTSSSEYSSTESSSECDSDKENVPPKGQIRVERTPDRSSSTGNFTNSCLSSKELVSRDQVASFEFSEPVSESRRLHESAQVFASRVDGTPEQSPCTGNRVIRLNEGPLPSKVLVPRDFATNVLAQFSDMKDKIENVVSKNKKLRDAARKRHERVRKKLVVEVETVRQELEEKDATIIQMRRTVSDLMSSNDRLRCRLSEVETALANQKATVK